MATNRPLLQEGTGLALKMCGEAPWGLSRPALRRWQPLWALFPEFLQIGPQGTSDWTRATAYCWAGGGPMAVPTATERLQGTLPLGTYGGQFLDTHVDRSVAAFLFLPYVLYYTNLIDIK